MSRNNNNKRKDDTRIVYGTSCVWWDSIDKVAANAVGLPSCPHCGSMLMEVPSIESWWKGVDEFERKGSPGYRALMEALRGRCFSSMSAAREALQR